MADVEIKKINERSVAVEHFLLMDTLWLYSTIFIKKPPNWQGFMSQIVNGHFECTAVIFNPMIPLNPETNESVYSTMLFVKEQAKAAGMCLLL